MIAIVKHDKKRGTVTITARAACGYYSAAGYNRDREEIRCVFLADNGLEGRRVKFWEI